MTMRASGWNAWAVTLVNGTLLAERRVCARARVEVASLNKIGVGEFGSGSSWAITQSPNEDIKINTAKIRKNDSDILLSIPFPPVELTTNLMTTSIKERIVGNLPV